MLRKIIGGNKASQVAASGVITGATYGAAVHGFSDRELVQIQRVAASSMTPSAKGRSLTALLLVRGDPTWRAAVAPLQQWARATWNAETNAELVERGIDTEFLHEAWHTQATKGTKRLFSEDGKRKWGSVSGPMDTITLSLDRLGWHANSPRVWTDDLGIVRSIPDISPKMWDILLKDAVHRMHERELAIIVSNSSNSMARVCVDVVTKSLASSKLKDDEKDKLATATCNGL